MELLGILGVLLFLAFLISLVVLPIFLANKLRKWLNKKGYRAISVIPIVAILALIVQQVYTAIYPTDDFFMDEFENNSNLTLPESSKIIATNASYPGIHGGYTSVAIIEVSVQDFEQLESSFSDSKKFEIDTTWQNIGSSEEYFRLSKKIDESNIKIVYSKKRQNYFKVAFMKDDKTIIFEQIES